MALHVSVTYEHYEAHILAESVMVGNDAILRCSIPSFLADLVSVVAWVDSLGSQLGFPSGKPPPPEIEAYL
jgi:hypothetical protein